MKVSIITVVYNGGATIRDTIESVINQSYKNIEYIIIDGGSKDNTFQIVKSYKNRINTFISEKDEGLYDAMNKGIQLANGDIIGILNSDDFYIDKYVIEKIINQFKTKSCDSVFADLIYVSSKNIKKNVRYYDSSNFNPEMFSYGWMPAHPTFFVKKQIYDNYGLYRTDFKLEGDFELLLRFLYVHRITYSYIQEPIIKMRTGGLSTSGLSSLWTIANEQNIACREHGIKTNILKIMSKYPKKAIELLMLSAK